jgi:hypothetical protein
METEKRYENFPGWIVLLSNLLNLLTYGLGFYIMLGLGWIFATLYLIYVLILEYRILRYHCVDCYYRGKICGFGRGLWSALFFKKGEPARFCGRQMTWKNMIPDLLVTLIPTVVGIILLILKFDMWILIAILVILLLTTVGNSLIRGRLTCKYCKQRDLGCPAEKLFNKE